MFHEKNPAIDKDIIMSKLSKLQQYLNYLREFNAKEVKPKPRLRSGRAGAMQAIYSWTT